MAATRSGAEPRWRSIVREVLDTLIPLIVLAAIWAGSVWIAGLPPKLFPSVQAVLERGFLLAMNGSLWTNVSATLIRLLFGFFLSVLIGVPLGLAMGRSRRVEAFFLPLISVLMPIPPLAWGPLFILWFGLGDMSTILLVTFAASVPIASTVWTGVRSVNEVWIRAASIMGVEGRAAFWKVILPGAMPSVLSALRLGMGRAWPALVSGEMIAGAGSGLGWMIFASRQFMSTDVMFVGIGVVGIIGLILERVLFQTIETRTLKRWGLMSEGAS
jgi:ABC-type nitrate/sulfonate/bicarbonate transport system permease component